MRQETNVQNFIKSFEADGVAAGVASANVPMADTGAGTGTGVSVPSVLPWEISGGAGSGDSAPEPTRKPIPEPTIAHPDTAHPAVADSDARFGSTHRASRKKEPIITEIEFDGQKFTAADFTSGDKPFKAVYKYHSNKFLENQAEERMAELSKALKVNGFRKMYQAYRKSMRTEKERQDIANVSQFDDQEIEMRTGEWQADETGVYRYGAYGEIEYACTHPIAPVERLKNIDTGEQKVRIKYRRGNNPASRSWSELLVDYDTISNARNIVNLAKMGVSVTSGRRAQNLVDFLADVMDVNYDDIPERKSVSIMGWNQEGFTPYVEGIEFDGNPAFQRTFSAITQVGSYEKWIEAAREVRNYSVTARIVLAASFAAPLIKPIGILPFFVHLWGAESGTGKTVSGMVAASVWGNPVVGGPLFPTFKSTSVGMEIMAGFLHNIPMIIDELQLAKDNRGRLIFNVYELASGSGKLRSNKSLGIAATPTWETTIITCGESPIVNSNDGAGALSRVIEIECTADSLVVEDGHKIAGIMKENYGYAGREFVQTLLEDENKELARMMYETIYEDCLKGDTTSKQAMAAAALITADALISEWIFKDGLKPLDAESLSAFLKTKEQTSVGARGYEYLCDWVARNANKMKKDVDAGERYGLIKDDVAYIYRTAFDDACEAKGFSPKSLLSYLKSNGLIEYRKDGKGLTKALRVGDVVNQCVVLRLPTDDSSDDEFIEKLDGFTNYDGPTPFA